MLSEKIIELLQKRIKSEEESSRLYKAMSVCTDYKGFFGASRLWAKYAKEESTHAQWAYNYLAQRNIKATVPELAAPPECFDGLVALVQASYDHEQKITMECNELADFCIAEKDYVTLTLALEYQKEQVEEEAKILFWLDRFEAFGDSEITLQMIDKEMGCKADE